MKDPKTGTVFLVVFFSVFIAFALALTGFFLMLAVLGRYGELWFVSLLIVMLFCGGISVVTAGVLIRWMYKAVKERDVSEVFEPETVHKFLKAFGLEEE